jgi:hypothetical protein
VEALYANYHALETVRQELHGRAQYYLLAPGEEMRHIRSATLYVEQASRTAFFQWELLSITDFIRDSHRSDFFTLRLKDLERAGRDTRHTLDYLAVFEAFVTDGEALGLIERARELIQTHLELYSEMAATLRPLANPPPVGAGSADVGPVADVERGDPEGFCLTPRGNLGYLLRRPRGRR